MDNEGEIPSPEQVREGKLLDMKLVLRPVRRDTLKASTRNRLDEFELVLTYAAAP